jgi:hypothetical protein
VVARELGCSERTGRRLLRDAEQRQQEGQRGWREPGLFDLTRTAAGSRDGAGARVGVRDA